MTVAKLSKYDVVVFDLDDTLYAEKSYVTSGYHAISDYIAQLFNIDFWSIIEKTDTQGNVLKAALEEAQLPLYLLPQLVEIYRYHQPKISLLPKVEEILATLRKANVPLYLITDGRSLTQRLKIDALNIKHYFEEIYISEEQGAGKPNLHSFNIVAKKHVDKHIVYIGDNPKKDFVAPHQLGWGSIGIKHTDLRVHPLVSIQEPNFWLERTAELLENS